MITRNRARKALAELQQQQREVPAHIETVVFVKPLQQCGVPVQTQSAVLVKPQQQSPESVAKEEESASASLEQRSTEGVASLAKKMNVISINSSSEEGDTPNSTEDAIDLSESSQSVIDLSSSDDGDDDDSDMSEDEDEEESEYSEEENREQREPTSATPARKLLAEEVTRIIRGGDRKKLKHDDCKAYLRNYGLRLTGTKPVLLDRIEQHIELKEGGSRSYERSTFTIDCTGDVCKGDVVVFNQKVYEKYSVAAKGAAQAGNRTVAGRVVKESYGAQKQQHTFTVEVLWSTGCRPLPPMKPLLVKGRNLYKRKTFRQEWADERERQRTLDEKHERGAAARQVRAVKQGRFKGRQKGSAGRVGLESSSRKQLANPYTETLASKENSNFLSGNVIQSALCGQPFAAVGNPRHVVHHHTATGANNVPLGRIRQFGPPSEKGAIREVTGGAIASVIKHRPWFKPAPSPLPFDRDVYEQEPSEAQHISSSPQLQRARRESDSAPRSLEVSVRVQAPIEIHVSQGASSRSGTTQSHSGQSASSLTTPPSPSPFPNRPSTTFLGRPASPFSNGPSTSCCRPPSPVPFRSSSTFSDRPQSPFPNRTSSASVGRRVSPSPNRPSSKSLGRSASPFPNRPTSQSLGRPMSPFPDRSSSRYVDRPVSPFPNRSSSTYVDRPLSPFSNRPPSPMAGFPNKPSVTNGSSRSALSSRSRDGRGVQSRHGRASAKSSKSQNGFPCPSELCTYRASRSCSIGVCYYCCKRKGGLCRNPRHDSQVHESSAGESFHQNMYKVQSHVANYKY